jgi:hypothetical protein
VKNKNSKQLKSGRNNCKRRLLKDERSAVVAVGIKREVNIDNFAVRVTIKTICVSRGVTCMLSFRTTEFRESTETVYTFVKLNFF